MYAADSYGLIPISPATLVAASWPKVNIFLRPTESDRPVLFYSGDDAPDKLRFATLCKSHSSKLYIDKTDRSKYQEYLRSSWEELISNDSLLPEQRVGVMSDIMRDVLAEDFATGDVDRIMSASRKLGRSASELLANCPVVMGQLFDVLHHDYGTFTHSTNVSMYAVQLALELGFSSQELEEISIGGLVHDLGKLKVDDRILNKPARLTELEFRVVKQHPTVGYRQLCHRQDINFDQLMMVYQHHEKIDGSGYPVGCTGEEIHPWAKICAVVDVYEALTSQRPYRKPISRETALAIIDKGDGTEFDSEILRCWRKTLNKRS